MGSSIIFQLKDNEFSEKRKPIFKKLEDHFLIENTKIKNATFPCKTVKKNRMVSTKWPYS